MTSTLSPPIFREVQRFHQWWLWALLLPIALSAWYAFIRQVLLDHPWGDRHAPDWAIILIWITSGIGLPALLTSLRLIVEVRTDGIHLRFFPLHRRFHRLHFVDLEGCEARTYRPIVEYGGWGIRYGRSGKAYNVSGNRGVQLRFKDGRKLLLGSQRAEDLASAIQARIPEDRGTL